MSDKLPADVLNFLWTRYYRWEHKSESDEAKAVLVAHGYLSDETTPMPPEVEYVLRGLVNSPVSELSPGSRTVIQNLLTRYGVDDG